MTKPAGAAYRPRGTGRRGRRQVDSCMRTSLGVADVEVALPALAVLGALPIAVPITVAIGNGEFSRHTSGVVGKKSAVACCRRKAPPSTRANSDRPRMTGWPSWVISKAQAPSRASSGPGLHRVVWVGIGHDPLGGDYSLRSRTCRMNHTP
jgi:hypothetical protein